MKKNYLFIIASCITMAVAVTSCQKSPDSSIVKNKDFDKLIEEAEKDEGKDKNIQDIAPDYDTYKNSFGDEALKVSVQADAAVDIPRTDKMSVLRVKQKDISQEFIDRFIENFAKDETLYDGSVTEIRTRSVIEEEISSLKSSMNELPAEEKEEKEEYQHQINELQKEYENAPVKLEWDSYISDKKIYPIDDILAKRDNSFYQWQKDLNPDGEVFYAVNDGKDGEYISMYAQNNDNYSNCFRYRKNKHGYNFTAAVAVGATPIQNVDYNSNLDSIWKAGEDIPEIVRQMRGNITEYEDERVSLSSEDAKTMADECIHKLGLQEFELYDLGLYCEIPDIRKDSEGKEPDSVGYNTVYIARYMRKIDDTFVTFDSEGKYEEGWKGDTYVKKIWTPESIEIRINDNGIVGFDYNAPVDIVDTVVDKSNMKSFEEVKDTFEKMVIAANANDDLEDTETDIRIDKVILGYVMISEENSYDTGLMVPAWDFIGLSDYGWTDENGQRQSMRANYGSVMTINAIDGTVINRSVGY